MANWEDVGRTLIIGAFIGLIVLLSERFGNVQIQLRGKKERHAEGELQNPELMAASAERILKRNDSGFISFAAETLAWAILAGFLLLLLQVREVEGWYYERNFAVALVPLLFGAAVTYLRRIRR